MSAAAQAAAHERAYGRYRECHSEQMARYGESLDPGDARAKPLQGKVAIVTGASSPVGIGAAVARRLAGSGARLLLAADASPDLVAKECADLLGDPKAVVPLQADLGRSGFRRRDGRRGGEALRPRRPAGQQCGRPDQSPVRRVHAAEFDKAVAVNLRAPFLASQAVLPAMRRQGGGRIVHVASQLGSVAYQTRTIYGMTKAALIHLAKSMALELAPRTSRSTPCRRGRSRPSRSSIASETSPRNSARRLDYVPMGRYGRPEEIGEVVHWLLTTDASFLTGHDLIVDGGYTIH